jgi:hypothetical protein
MSFNPDIWGGIFDIPQAARRVGKGQIVGFRLCTVDEDDAGDIHLASYGAGDYRWRPGVNQAACPTAARRQRALHKVHRAYRHVAPMRDCSCGFYAGTDVAALRRILGLPSNAQENVLCGIQAWGKIVVHDWGFRAEYARIIALSEQLPSRVLRGIDGRVISVQAKRGIERQIAAYLADKYRATLIDLAGMPSAMAGFGDFLQAEG